MLFRSRDFVGNQLIKRVVSVRDAFPVPNDNMFAEYYDKKNVLHVVYGDSLFKDQKKELFERK